MPEKPLAGAVVRAPKPASRFDWPSVVVLAVVSGKPAVADRGWFCQPEVAVLAPALGVAATWSCLQGLLAPKRPHDSQPVNPSPAKNTLARAILGVLPMGTPLFKECYRQQAQSWRSVPVRCGPLSTKGGGR